VLGDGQITVSLMFVSSNTSTQLVQVAKPIPIGVVDKDRIGIGNVQPTFNDRRRQQQVKLMIDKIDHDLFQFTFAHLPMTNSDSRLRDDLP